MPAAATVQRLEAELKALKREKNKLEGILDVSGPEEVQKLSGQPALTKCYRIVAKIKALADNLYLTTKVEMAWMVYGCAVAPDGITQTLPVGGRSIFYAQGTGDMQAHVVAHGVLLHCG